MRISQENENSQGASSHQSTSAPKTQETVCLKFPKKARIRKQHEYQLFRKLAKRYLGLVTILEYRKGRFPYPRLGITVSKKYGRAHARNRFKRLIREAFRLIRPSLPAYLEIHALPRAYKENLFLKDVIKDFTELKKELWD